MAMERNETISLRWWGCGAFDVIMHDVNISFDPYLFGENLETAKPIFDYIFLSHEHFDHASPMTLGKLCRGERFKNLVVCPGCVFPNEPIGKNYGDAASKRDLPLTKHIPRERIQIMYPRYRDDRQRGRPWESDDGPREFPGPRELELGPLRVETVESGENERPDLPTNGYLVEHTSKNVSFLHIGDMHVPFPELEQIAGRVDFLIHMKVGLTEYGAADESEHLRHLVDWVKPRYFIPIHYRTDRKRDPIPEGTWPPDVTDVAAFIEHIREVVGNRTQVLPFTAGVEYEVELPEKRVLWKWQWKKTWTDATWV